MFQKNWIQLQYDEGHESTCRWAGNVMTTMAMTGVTERTGMTGATVRNGGSWNLSESRRTWENLRIPKPFQKFGGWCYITFVLLHPDWWLMIHHFESAFFWMWFLIYVYISQIVCEMLSGILWTLCGAKFCHIKCQERGWCEATQSPQQHGKLRRPQKHCNSQEIQKNDMFHVVVSLLLVVLCALHPLASNSVSQGQGSQVFLILSPYFFTLWFV